MWSYHISNNLAYKSLAHTMHLQYTIFMRVLLVLVDICFVLLLGLSGVTCVYNILNVIHTVHTEIHGSSQKIVLAKSVYFSTLMT